MPRALTWSDLKIGVAAFVGVAAIAAWVLTFARIGVLHGATTTIYMVANEASEVRRGTEVWLAGQKVGKVRDIRFLPPTADSTERLLIEMQILSSYMPHIRRNSGVQIRPGRSLIAEPVVAITAGATDSPPILAGDTLRALAQLTRRPVSADLSALGDSLIAETQLVQGLMDEVRGVVEGPIARIRRQSEIQAATVNRAINRVSERATASHGLVSSLTAHDTTLRNVVVRVHAQVDSIRLLLYSDRTSLGRFRRDSTLLPALDRLAATTDTLRRRFAGGIGAAAGGDSALARQMERLHRSLDSLAADVRHHPVKYVAF